MILDGALVSSRYKDKFIYTSCGCLFHGILDQRFVHYRQHFFGQGLVAGRNLVPRPPTGKIAFLIIKQLSLASRKFSY